MLELTTKEAVLKILRDNPEMSKYRLAKILGLNPIMINNYIREVKPCRMGFATSSKVLNHFDIVILDKYNPTKVPE